MYMDKYKSWVENEYFDKETREELKGIANNESEIEDRFYKDLEFGTGGMRGKIGAGTNRINIYTVAKATQGLAEFIIEKGQGDLSAVIAHDSRHKSKEFTKTAALVLAANGIKAYVFDDLRPTPELSFAVRELKANAGIVVTASHNPPQYNGYKVYGDDGSQMVPSVANKLIEKINNIKDYADIKIMEEKEALEKGLFNILDKEIDDIYIEKVKELSVRENVNKDINVVYTPLHGTGNIPVRRVLDEIGYKNVFVVPKQEKPDPEFSTVDYPNPEDPNAFKLAMKLGQEVNADILLGTDPDCDRVGVVVKNNQGEYIVLNGNQTGALLLDYILKAKKEKDLLSSNDVLIKTIVTSELGRVIASHYGLETLDTLTGFKFIGEKIREFEENGDKKFAFGYEESFGYLTGTFVRDKDAVIASMLICEMTAYHKENNMSLYEALEEVYKKYGYYIETLEAITLEGIEGVKAIERIMNSFRNDYPTEINGNKLVKYNDYKEGIDGLPKSNVLKFIFEDGCWYALRPSGTEPKIKIYISVNGITKDEARNKLEVLKREILPRVK